MTGAVYAADDPRLIGTGNPPSVPMAPGQGCCQLVPRIVAENAAVATSEDKTFRESYQADAKPRK